MSQKTKIKCAIFDMDGTVVEVPYDWTQIKRELNTEGKPILNYLEDLDEPEKSKKWEILKAYEKEATQKAVVKEGISDLLTFIKKNKIITALVTNNSKVNVFYLLKKFSFSFDLVLTRESGLWKPSAEPFLKVFEKFSLHSTECCAIGDSHFDILAAKEAGIKMIFIVNKNFQRFKEEDVEVFPSVKKLKKRMSQLIS